jgi:hypothetical protein
MAEVHAARPDAKGIGAAAHMVYCKCESKVLPYVAPEEPFATQQNSSGDGGY